MEHLFSPCTRLQDTLEIAEGFDENILGHMRELELNVSIEELLNAERAFTYADLYAMLNSGITCAWVTPTAAVMCADGASVPSSLYLLISDYTFSFIVDGKDIIAAADSPDDLLEICDVVLRLLAASAVRSMILKKHGSPDNISINATSLVHLMEQCQSLKALTLEQLALDENHCNVLGTYSRPDLEIELIRCELTSAGTSALAEILGHNQGPTRLELCSIDYSVLANGLRGNSRLKRLSPTIFNGPQDGNRQVLALAGALRENIGLVELNLCALQTGLLEKPEAWSAICDSLETHPTLEILNLSATFTDATMASAVLISRILAIVKMLKVSLSIHTIYLPVRYSEHWLFRKSVIPHLETNRLRPRVRAIQKIRPSSYRAKVLERALLSTRTNANSFWMLLSGNAEVAFPSTTPTATLPTPTTAAAAATSNVAPIVATPAATGAPTIYGATPTVGQKRKA